VVVLRDRLTGDGSVSRFAPRPIGLPDPVA